MGKYLVLILLIPTLAFADALVYVSKTPTVVVNKLQGPQAYVEVAGVKVDQPIAITSTGTPVWAVLVTDNQLATINKDAAFLGKGLDAVKAKDAAIYDKLTVAEVDKDNVATGKRLPMQVFSGWNAETGDLEGVKPVKDVTDVIKVK